MALQQADAHRQLHEGVTIKTLGADKGYHQKNFVQGCRERGIAPQVACKDKVQLARQDGRIPTQRSFQANMKIRKRVEEIFGRLKTVSGLRRSRCRDRERAQAWGRFVPALCHCGFLRFNSQPPMERGEPWNLNSATEPPVQCGGIGG